MNIKFEYINKLFYKMINLFISGSDSGKAQDGSCKLKFIKLNLPENYENTNDNNKLPESIKIEARNSGSVLIVRTSKFGNKTGAFYLKGDFNTDYNLVERKVIDNYLNKICKTRKCWLSGDRMW
tara:strand:- start:294 stop:665 length:372 start_codon:yes stop_codon:yes gene_type:complete